MRLTKMVCTLGPTSNSPEGIRALAKAGMNVARLNFSHGTVQSQQEVLQRVKAVNAEGEFTLGILLDTKGAEIRTGEVTEPIIVVPGQEVLFSFDEIANPDLTVIRVNYKEFSQDVKKAECILVDNGETIFDVIEVRADGAVHAKSRDNGKIGSRRHINLPGADVSLPSLMPTDWEAIEMGCKEDADFVALSFIRRGDEIPEVREFIKKHGGTMKIITKVETRQSVEDIEAVIRESDGIMVARGDLGAEMPFEKIPRVQNDIVDRCIKAGKPVIVATHMLESMIQNPIPTRAEVTDVFHAAETYADSTMLSGESANGKYPFKSAESMAKILVEAESTKQRGSIVERAPHHSDAMRIINEAKADDVEAIVISSETEELPAAISALRPNMPIVVCSGNAKILRMLQLRFAIYPVAGSDVSGAKKWLKPGTKVITASAENPAPSVVTL